MKLNTRHFGEITVDESKALDFIDGLPGFPDETKFLLIKNEPKNGEHDGLFWWLQSTNDGEVSFPMINVFAIMPDYNPMVETEDVASLGAVDPQDLIVYNIVVIPEDASKMTVNLKAPVVINTKTMKGKQIISNNDDYSVRFSVMEGLKSANN